MNSIAHRLLKMSNNVQNNQWFHCICPNPKARLSLFCFPYAGGSTTTFYNWPYELPSDVEIIVVQMPGLGTRLTEPPLTSVSQVVPLLTDVFCSQLSKPFALFGHCLGALISFELARELSRQSDFNPVHLFISGIPAPQIQDAKLPIHQLADSDFLEELYLRHRGITKEILQNPDIVREFLPGLKANFEMYETYKYINGDLLDCPITVFGGTQDTSVSREGLVAWGQHTRDGFTLHMIPGDHYFILYERQRFLRRLSDQISKILVRLH